MAPVKRDVSDGYNAARQSSGSSMVVGLLLMMSWYLIQRGIVEEIFERHGDRDLGIGRIACNVYVYHLVSISLHEPGDDLLCAHSPRRLLCAHSPRRGNGY